MDNLKIVSLNTKTIQSDEKRLNNFITLLNEENPDIICLQDVSKKGTKYISRSMDMTNYIWHRDNCIITKSNIKINKDKYFEFNNSDKGAIMVTVGTYQWKLNVMITHLDSVSENTRLNQLNDILSVFDDVDILVGCMNYIRKDDYTDSDIEEIKVKRSQAGIEEVKWDVMGKIDNIFYINPFIEQTCQYSTRVDYILTNKKLNVERTDSVLDTIKSNISDHNMIVTVLKTIN